MLYTREQVKDNIRNRDGKRVFFLRKGDQLTPGARDYLTRERIEIRSAETAAIREYRLLCGGVIREKPEYMTHLHGDVLVVKNHPRIAFRGALDRLESEIMLCKLEMPTSEQALEELLELTRLILRCEVMSEPLPEAKLCGLTPQELRLQSHDPQTYFGIPHFMPRSSDGREILLLNRLRTLVREAELRAVDAFYRPEGQTDRQDILQAMNRMSSMLYILMLQIKAGK